MTLKIGYTISGRIFRVQIFTDVKKNTHAQYCETAQYIPRHSARNLKQSFYIIFHAYTPRV